MLFNSALKQSASVRKDLEAFADSPTGASLALQGKPELETLLILCNILANISIWLLGQISASLASFSRTIDDYDGMVKKELVPAKQEKGIERVKNFRAELAEYRERFAGLKNEREETVSKISFITLPSVEFHLYDHVN